MTGPNTGSFPPKAETRLITPTGGTVSLQGTGTGGNVTVEANGDATLHANALAEFALPDVANDFSPVVTGLAHTSTRATVQTIDKSKAWEAFGLGDHDWVPMSDRAGLGLNTKGQIAVRGADGIIPMDAPPDGYYRRAKALTITGFEDVAPTGTGAPVNGTSPTIATPTITGGTMTPASVDARLTLSTELGTPTVIAVASGSQVVATQGRYVASAQALVSIVDCLRPAAPVLLSENNVLTAGTARKIAWVGDVLWVLRDDGNLQLLNAKTPKAVTAFAGGTGGVVSVGGSPRGMDVCGDLGFIATPNGSGNNFIVVDGSDKASPKVIGTLALGDYNPYSVKVSGKLAFIVLNNMTVSGQSAAGALQAIDVSDPTAPAAIVGGAGGIVACPQTPRGLDIDNGIAYVTACSGGGATLQLVYAIDLKDPATPVVLGSAAIGAFARFTALAGTKLFIPLANVSQFQVFDIADPTAPRQVGSTLTSAVFNWPNDTAVGNGFIAIANSGATSVIVIPLTSNVAADFASLGETDVQGLRVRRNISTRGSVHAAGGFRGIRFALDNPPVLATGAGHTVDDLIAVLQAQGTLRQ